MAEYVLVSAPQTLQLLKHEVQHIPELRSQIEAFQVKLRHLLSILQIADATQETKEAIRSWAAETRELAYDVEDVLLEAVSARKEENKRLMKYVFRKESTSLEKRIQTLDARISALESDLRVRHIRPPHPPPCTRQTRFISHRFEEVFVGLDEFVEELVEKLVQTDSYQVVSITGVGGIGKTTKAKRIFYHAKVRRHFDAFAWVCVSQQFQQEDVLKRILHKLQPEKKMRINNMNTVEKLVEELSDFQRRKRCLVVLDDIWRDDLIRCVFPTRQANIKLLITARNHDIAQFIDRVAPCYLYVQRHLDEFESWELLKKKVFRGLNIAGGDGSMGDSSVSDNDESVSSGRSFRTCLSDEEDDEAIGRLDTSTSDDCIQDPRNQNDVERLGKEMVEQCGGLPLAIILLGGILMTKSTLSEWRKVHQNFSSLLRRGRSFRENGPIQDVLALSYDDLSYQLKPCFLFLANFPEDSKIPTRKLYQLWASEGFISQECGEAEEEESVMDIGERYLGELVQRCMVHVQVEEATGRFKHCRLHDLTRELCHIKVKEDNFLRKAPPRYETELAGSPISPTTVTSVGVIRRLSVAVEYDFDTYYPPKDNKCVLIHVRSAMFFSRIKKRRNLQPALDFICNEVRGTRVLDMERFEFNLSKDIGNLVLLRYLSLRGSEFNKLPSSIGNLKYMQTLDLRVPFHVCLAIPDEIGKLKHLKHLYLPPNHTSNNKLRLGNLSKLEILKNFDTRFSGYRDISHLRKLNKLTATLFLGEENLALFIIYLKNDFMRDSSFRIRYDFQLENELDLLRQIVGVTHLRKLDLIGHIKRLPQHGHFSESLTKLTLRNSELREDPIATLQKLPNLYSLILRKNVFEGREICCSSHGFPRLGKLELQGLVNLECWTIEEGAMPSLYYLKIDECNSLRMIPEGIKFVATLKELVIANMPDTFKLRIQNDQQEDGEDMYKVEHVASVIIVETDSTHENKLGKQLSGIQDGYTTHLPHTQSGIFVVDLSYTQGTYCFYHHLSHLGLFLLMCSKLFFWPSSKYFSDIGAKGMAEFVNMVDRLYAAEFRHVSSCRAAS